MAWLGIIWRAAGMGLRNGILDWAAALSFYFLFALFPALLLIAAMLGTFHMNGLAGNVVAAIARDLPRPAANLVSGAMADLLSRHVPGLFSFGLVLALYSASQGFTGLMSALNASYEVRETRPYWRRLLLALGLTCSVGVLVVLALAMLVMGERLLVVVAGPLHAGFALTLFWPVIRWGCVLACMVFAVTMLYRHAPNHREGHESVLPAAVTALVLWLSASALLASYINNFSDYSTVYGSLGAVIALMLWFYVFALSLLLGAEIDQERLRAKGAAQQAISSERPGPRRVA